MPESLSELNTFCLWNPTYYGCSCSHICWITIELNFNPQVENVVGDYEKRSTEVIVPSVARFAAATSDDSLWKQFNYLILLKTRHSSPQVHFRCCIRRFACLVRQVALKSGMIIVEGRDTKFNFEFDVFFFSSFNAIKVFRGMLCEWVVSGTRLVSSQ